MKLDDKIHELTMLWLEKSEKPASIETFVQNYTYAYEQIYKNWPDDSENSISSI